MAVSSDKSFSGEPNRGRNATDIRVKYGFDSFSGFEAWYADFGVEDILEQIRQDYDVIRMSLRLEAGYENEGELNPQLDGSAY